MVFQQHETQTKQEIHAETLHRISNLMANVAPTVLVCSKHYFRLILFNSRNKKVRKLCFFWPQNAAHRKVEFLSLVEEQCRHLRKGKRINVQHGSCIESMNIHFFLQQFVSVERFIQFEYEFRSQNAICC